MTTSFLLAAVHPLEGVFLGSGKAGVVVGVAALILLGLLGWMWRAHRRLASLEQRITAAEAASENRKNVSPIAPQRP